MSPARAAAPPGYVHAASEADDALNVAAWGRPLVAGLAIADSE